MKSRKHLVSRFLFALMKPDETNGVALSPASRFSSHQTPQQQHNHNGQDTNANHPSSPLSGFGPGILQSGGDDEDLEQSSLEDADDYEDMEEDPNDMLDKREKLLDSDVVPYHKRPGFCMSS